MFLNSLHPASELTAIFGPFLDVVHAGYSVQG